MSARLSIAIAGAFGVLACAHGHAGQGASPPFSDVITRQELRQLSTRTLYEAIQQLRPRWLQVVGGPRSSSIETNVAVFQDNMQLGTQDVLKQMGTEGIYEIRYMDGTTAKASLPGLSGHVEGAIMISMHPPKSPDKH